MGLFCVGDFCSHFVCVDSAKTESFHYLFSDICVMVTRCISQICFSVKLLVSENDF